MTPFEQAAAATPTTPRKRLGDGMLTSVRPIQFRDPYSRGVQTMLPGRHRVSADWWGYKEHPELFRVVNPGDEVTAARHREALERPRRGGDGEAEEERFIPVWREAALSSEPKPLAAPIEIGPRCSGLLGAQRPSLRAEGDQFSRQLEYGAGRSVEGQILDFPRSRVVQKLGDDPALVGMDRRRVVLVRERDDGSRSGAVRDNWAPSF